MQKRYVYIPLSDDCQILTTETFLKKLCDKHSDKYGLLTWRYLTDQISPLKETRGQFRFKGKDGTYYRLAASRIQ